MKDIVAFSNKTIAKTEDNMNDTENRLKNIAEKEEYSNILDAIKNNETNKKRLLQERKFKKYNNLKQKPKPRKDHNQLNIKEDCKNHVQVLCKVITMQIPLQVSCINPASLILKTNLKHS